MFWQRAINFSLFKSWESLNLLMDVLIIKPDDQILL